MIFHFSFFIFHFSYAQPSVFKADPDGAKQFFDNRNYYSALKVYQLLLKSNPKNIEYNYKAAQCYLLSNSIKAKAIPHLELIIKEEKYPDEVWIDLGKAYQYGNKFDEAISAYNNYKTKLKEKTPGAKSKMVARYIEQCHNGKELIKHPLNITFENLGKHVNCGFPDFYPFVTSDESSLYFTTRRKSPTAPNPEFDGLYSSDIFFINKKDGKWRKTQSIGNNINTNLDEEIVDISDDGTVMLFYIDHIELFGDIWISRRLNNKSPFLKSEPLPESINAGMETSASIYKDPVTESEIILLASSRPGTATNLNYGETDIYIARKLPNGLWSEPQNLGPNINTEFKEEFPHLSEDGKILYFASQGHSSMGGFDIFKSTWDEAEQSWLPPKNLGYPINTTDDNLNISFVSRGRIAYISAMREGGQGDLDIYRIVLEDIEVKETIYKGYITSSDTLNKISRAKIEIINKKNNELYGIYIPDPNTCYYVMALPPGKWIMKIEAEGYDTYLEDINIFDQTMKFSPEVTKNIKIKKL
ncbi:MAG: hypothetical protein V1781_03420 [Bacteroidota bacterium]